MIYTKQDHKRADQTNRDEMRRTRSPVGDYETHLDAARRQRIYSTPLGQRIAARKLK
jgi:hypothetical protein